MYTVKVRYVRLNGIDVITHATLKSATELINRANDGNTIAAIHVEDGDGNVVIRWYRD